MRDRSMVLSRATSSGAAVEAGETRGDDCDAGSRCLRRCLESGRNFAAVWAEAATRFDSWHQRFGEQVRSLSTPRFASTVTFRGVFRV